MAKSVPVRYLDLGEKGTVIRQDFFWVIKPASGENKIYSIDNHLMIFSSKEKALSLVGNFIPECSTIEIIFWDEIIRFNPNLKKAVLDYSRDAKGARIWMDLSAEDEDINLEINQEKE